MDKEKVLDLFYERIADMIAKLDKERELAGQPEYSIAQLKKRIMMSERLIPREYIDICFEKYKEHLEIKEGELKEKDTEKNSKEDARERSRKKFIAEYNYYNEQMAKRSTDSQLVSDLQKKKGDGPRNNGSKGDGSRGDD